MPDVLFLDEMTDADAHLVGGKALGLGTATRAGLPVPAGFVVTTQAYRRLAARGVRADPGLVRAIGGAYETLGSGRVAVRSSATAEDAADASAAGQQETFLGVQGVEPLLDAIERCWRSLFTERAVAYRAERHVNSADLAMAVVVQQLVPAEAAGVLFTRDPLDPDGTRMLAESAWGLGEVVVAGRVQPDRFTLDRETGAVLTRTLGLKAVRVVAGVEEHVPAELQREFSLSAGTLVRLAELGRQVEALYGDARDIEWAYANDRFALLQARPITAAGAVEREQVRRAVIAELKGRADPKGTAWARYNLSEVLPEPTPMTWAVVQRLLGADGGCGAMNRDLGARPDPALGGLSGFDLVAGRPMANLSRLPRMQFSRPPFEYPLGEYRRDPRKALDPKPVLNPLAGSGCVFGVLTLPRTVLNLARLMGTTKRLSATFAMRFEQETAPAFARSVAQALAQRWSGCEPDALLREFNAWVHRTLVDFARESLKPTVFADLAWSEVFAALKPGLGAERARAAVGELSLGAAPPAGTDLAGAVRDLAAGRLTRADFLMKFGHRGPNEMELAQPRWSEAPQELDKLIRGAGGAPAGARGPEPALGVADADRIATEAKLVGSARDRFLTQVQRLRTYLGLREAGKHYLLMGYAVIRRALLELDRRFGLNGGIFFLTPSDLPELLRGADLSAKVAAARRRRQTELSLEVPPVLFSDDLEAIGRPLPVPPGGAVLEGVPLSAGVAEGAALVLTAPTAVPPEGGYVLVCPSTDPAWVPLFVGANALVMETGGVLSHGAIVAREFGLPAVAGLPGATRQLKTGQRLRVDGARGTVTIVGGDAVHLQEGR